jgi:hypothetical protein
MVIRFHSLKKLFMNRKRSRSKKDLDRLIESARSVRWEAEQRKRLAKEDHEIAWLEKIISLARECENAAVQNSDD